MKIFAKLFVLGLSLIAVAVAGQAPTAEASQCIPPACFASPGCCFDRQCDDFCGGRGLGVCGQSQCCTCAG